MREGGLEAPTRHALDWRKQAFYNADALDDELRRVLAVGQFENCPDRQHWQSRSGISILGCPR